MEETKELFLNQPIPGESLSAEPGKYPFDNPPLIVSPVESMQYVLDNYLLLPESEIHRRAFGFDRTIYSNNKKYADMLRRGLTKGLYKRVHLGKGASSKYPQSEYFYFTNHFKQC